MIFSSWKRRKGFSAIGKIVSFFHLNKESRAKKVNKTLTRQNERFKSNRRVNPGLKN